MSIMSGSAEGHYPSPPASNRSSPQISVDSIRQLDQAYQRVRQLRRDILQTYIPRTQDNSISMGPPHEAIVLSGGGGEGNESERQNSSDRDRDSALLERLNAPLPQETMDRLRQFEAAQLQSDAEHPHPHPHTTRTLRSLRMTTSHLVPEERETSSPSSSPRPLPSLRPHNLNLPPSPISPISPPRQPFLPPRTLEPSHTPRWTTSLSDDPHTSLGRRVAAVLGTGDRPTTTTTTTPPPADQDTRRTSQTPLARDLEHVLSISRHQRSELAHMYIESYRHEMDRLARGPSQDTGTGASSPSPSSSSARNGMRRARQIRADSRQNSGSGSASGSGSGSSGSRLSTLSNFSVQNLPTPTTSHQTTLLFEEPTSYEPHPPSFSSSAHPEERMESIYEEGRNFVSSFRNEVPESSGPWDSAPRRMYASPSREWEVHRRRVVRYPEDVVPASNVVRLNADGDPVPFEEHAHSHSHWPRWNSNISNNNSSDDLRFHHHPHPHHHHIRPSPNQQIVILPDGQEEIWPADLVEVQLRPRVILGKSDPYCPDYLPMPLPSEREREAWLEEGVEVPVSRAGCLIAR